MNIQNIDIAGIVAMITNLLLWLVTTGVIVLAAGWMLQRLGINFVRLPAAGPQELVYAAGIIWLLRPK